MGTRKRQLKAAERPAFTRQDAWFLAELPVLLVVATFFPERMWAGVCYRLERLKSRLGAFSPAAIQSGLNLMPDSGTRADDAYRVAAARSEHHIQIIREFLWRRSARVELEAADHLSAALEEGRGAVLWVAHFSFNALMSKKALHQSGFEVSHLSRPEHGFSKSAFGISFLNPMRVRTELRYLRGRIIIDRRRPISAVQKGRRQLEANQIISITAGAWEGTQLASVDIKGCRLELATGAPGLAYLTGAALLPVFTVRESGTTDVRVIIGAPIDVDRNVKRSEALSQAAQAFANRLEPYIDSYPLQWRDWEKIRPQDG